LVVSKSDPDVCTTAPCYSFTTRSPTATTPTAPYLASRRLACLRAAEMYSTWAGRTYSVVNDNFNPSFGMGSCYLTWVYSGTTYYAEHQYFYQSASPSSPVDLPSTMQELQDKIAAQSGWPTSSAISRALADAVASGEPLTASTPTLTGPTTVAGPTSTTTQQQKDPAGNVTGTVTKVSQTTYNISYNNNTITNTSSTVVTTTNPDGSKTVENQDSPPAQDGATDSPLPDVPTLYTKKYPDGLEGVWQQKKDQLKNSPLLQLTNSLMPSIGTGGTCPSFMIPLDVGIRDFGVHDVAPPCYVWDWAKVIVIVSALLLARALIFGG